MDDPWKDFLTHTALTDNEYAEVGWCDLQGYVESVVESFAVSYNIVTLLYALKFRCVHILMMG